MTFHDLINLFLHIMLNPHKSLYIKTQCSVKSPFVDPIPNPSSN